MSLSKVAGLALASAMAIGTFVAATVQPAQAAAGFTVSGGRLLDANGTPFVMRGVNHAHTWYPDRTPQALADIKALGANSVRVVLSSGFRWTRTEAATVSTIISTCRAQRLICVLEVHDTTGFGEDGAAGTLAQAVDYWVSIRNALVGQERYVILNIGNEPWGNSGATAWTGATRDAITRLRAAGFDHTIMVDAPNWGQDWQFIMRDNATSLFNADPQRNVVFSIHMYGVFDTAAEINAYFNAFATAGLPLVVGEFGHNHSDGNPDEDTILAEAQRRGLGYLGWSWSGNGSGVEYLDLVTGFNRAALSSWGQRLFNGANGIRTTSREATVYSGGTGPTPSNPPSTPPSDPPSSPPVGNGCTAVYAVTGQWADGFQGKVTVTARSAIRGWTVTWTWANGQRLTNSWNATITTSGSAVTARNVAYNGTLAAGASAEFGFTGASTGTNPAPVATCTATA